MSCRLEPAWVEFGDQYMARVAWFPDGSVGIQVESRDQLKLQLIRFDPRTGKSTVLLEETSEVIGVQSNSFEMGDRATPGMCMLVPINLGKSLIEEAVKESGLKKLPCHEPS